MSRWSWNKKPRDPVDEQLRDIARQGAGMARVAHFFAMLLLILFSLASFVALAGDAFTKFLAERAAGRVDIPSAISVLVSVLIVPAFDWAMLYAASVVRIMTTRGAGGRRMWVHVTVIVVVSLVEGAAYIYMSAVYEHPATPAAWAIVAARGVTAPLLAVYLSMAHPLPVTAADIVYRVEFATGAGVIREAVRRANEPDVPLDQRMATYRAAADMEERIGARLDAMIATLQAQQLRIAPPDDGENTRSDASETGLHIVPSEARPRFTAKELSVERKRLEEAARRNKAYAFLDAHPRATGNQLRAVLGCNRTVAGQLHRDWRDARSAQPTDDDQIDEGEAIDA